MNWSGRFVRVCFWLLVWMALGGTGLNSLQAAENPWKLLIDQMDPLCECLAGKNESFTLQVDLQVEIDSKPQTIEIVLTRSDADSFHLRCSHPDYAVELQRSPELTILSLPLHAVQFVGTGPAPKQDHLAPQQITRQLIDSDSQLSLWAPLLRTSPQTWALLLRPLKNLQYLQDQQQWIFNNSIKVKAVQENSEPAPPGPWQLKLHGENWQAMLRLTAADPQAAVTPGITYRQTEIDRSELERQLTRGVRRALAVLAPSFRLTAPEQQPLQVEHGELRWVEGQRLALLSGTPEQIGRAHAQLLRSEATRCMDSVLYTFGTVQTVRTGRWFRQDLEEAYARLSPHIPEDHQRELTALAEELGWEPGLVKTLNVFPELFHCSGFALFDSATKDGTLYHGRVLDYMTTIGLQDSAVTFIIAPEGKIPFANVGYGGFVGSVSGMNQAGISLGEMGGRGEGQWDGVPMATLMRRALEECQTLQEVKDLWSNNPRTCEYYYVFADGKTRQAVGVAATPEKIEFLEPGTAHPLLGPGIPDAVLLSAGSRLETLRARVQEKHGQIDTDTALWLMSRPVAMKSNLHNVLFVPEQGLFYVANATHQEPAAERPYVKFDLQKCLQELKERQTNQATTLKP